MSRLQGLVMKPLPRRLFYGINFTPSIRETGLRQS
jgi:hypothetical protein